MEKDLVKIRGKSVTIASDNNHVVCVYHYNIPDAVKKTKDKS